MPTSQKYSKKSENDSSTAGLSSTVYTLQNELDAAKRRNKELEEFYKLKPQFDELI